MLIKRCEAEKKKWESLLWLIGVIVGVVAAHWLILLPRIENAKKEAVSAAKDAVLSQETLTEISSRLRPYAVIDVAPNNLPGNFKYDARASDIIDSVAFSRSESKRTGVLIFKMKKFVPIAPLVRPLTPLVYIQSFWPTNKFDWAYEIHSGFTTVIDASGNQGMEVEQELPEGKSYTFFVELFTN